MARKHRLPVAYVNQFGGNDDLVFDGRSCVFDADGAVDRARPLVRRRRRRSATSTPARPIAAGRTISTRSRRSGARWCSARATTRASAASRSAVLGLSGGIDSALTAAIAAEALGADHVLGVLMPSPYSSRGSIDDALALAANLGIETLTLPIEPLMRAFDGTLRAALRRGPAADVTEENIQARIRGNLLMALSNKRGALLLTTGNKSELSVGYCTLYGDMSGGLGGDRRRAEDDGLPRGAVAERDARDGRSHSRGDPDQGAVRGAAAGPDRPGLAAALRRPRRHPAAARRAASAGRGDRRGRLRRRHRARACCAWCGSRSSSASRRRRD